MIVGFLKDTDLSMACTHELALVIHRNTTARLHPMHIFENACYSTLLCTVVTSF